MRTSSERKHLHIRRFGFGAMVTTTTKDQALRRFGLVLDVGKADWVFVSFVCMSLGFDCDGDPE